MDRYLAALQFVQMLWLCIEKTACMFWSLNVPGKINIAQCFEIQKAIQYLCSTQTKLDHLWK